MTTAIFGRRCEIVRSDSSPSTTSQPDPGAGVAAELRHLAADQERRVGSELVEDERDHRCSRRLAVRAGDHDRVLQRDQLGQQLRPRASGNLAGEGRRDDRLPALRRALRRVGDRDRDPGGSHVLEVRRLVAVPTGHLRAPGLGEQRVARKPRPADADEPEPAPLKTQAQSAPPRSRPQRSASRRAASPRSSPSAGRDRPATSAPGPARGRARSPEP